MKNSVIIKSFQNGISVYLDDKLSFLDLVKEVELKFRESGKFFGDAIMAISFENRVLTEEEEITLLEAVCTNCKINIACIIGKDGVRNQTYLKALKKIEDQKNERTGQFYRGSLKDGEMFETESSIIVLGDVYPGCSVVSSKDIIILGTLYGEAYAGGNGDEDRFVVALNMSPEKLQIGDLRFNSNPEKRFLPIKSKMLPKIAYVKRGMVVMEPITKELLSEIIVM